MSGLLGQQVLVLNRLWQAVNVCSVRRALTLLFQGHAQVVLNEADGSFQTYSFREWRDLSLGEPHPESIHTISFKIRVPRVILLLVFDQVPAKEVKFTRHNIFERDKNTCQYCGSVFDRRDLNLDHVIPRDRGGPTTWDNIVCSCIRCNTRKGNRTPQEAGMRLIRKPKRPKWRPFLHVHVGLPAHEQWKHFVDLAYWNVELGEDMG
jgi:5-methylcytosine-specific restriction endonuclease McrA